ANLGLYQSGNGGNSWTQAKGCGQQTCGFPLARYDANLGGFFHIDLIYEPTRAMYIAAVSKQGLFCSRDCANWRPCGELGLPAGLPPAATIERASLATRDGKIWAFVMVDVRDVSGGAVLQLQLLELNANGSSWRSIPGPPVAMKGSLMYV